MHKNKVFPDRQGTLLFSHRGLHTKERENTIKAFKAGIAAGAEGIELDVHLTKDGKLVVIHDHNTKRTTGIDKEIEAATYEELIKIDSEIPLLEEVFECFGSTILYDIELKSNLFSKSPLEKLVWECIQSFKLKENVIVSSFNPFTARFFQIVSKSEVPVAIIYDIDEKVPKIAQKGLGRYLFRPSILKPGRNVVDREVKKGTAPLAIWCLDTPEDAVKYKSHARIIISNRPDLIRGMV